MLGRSLIRYLTPENIRLVHVAGDVHVVINGRSEPVVRLYRAFPQTDPDLFIGLMDGSGHEIGMIRDPASLDPSSRDLLESELKAIYFVPKILEIRSVETEGTGRIWDVLTDDGDRRFRIQGRDALDGSDPPRIDVVDEGRKRYCIEDYWELDRQSQDLIRSLLPDKVLRARYGKSRLSKHSGSRGGMVSGFR